MAEIIDTHAPIEDVCGRSWRGGLRAHLRDAASAGAPFALVLILAGTNDLAEVMARRSRPQDVVAALRALHASARGCGCLTVALTVPEHPAEGAAGGAGVRHAREAINAGLRALAVQGDVDALADIAAALPHSDPSLWDDGLHLSGRGYDRLAELAYEHARGTFDRV